MLVEIKDIINPEITIPCNTGEETLSLREREKHSKVYEVRIKKVSPETVAFTLDHKPSRGKSQKWFQQLSPYVNRKNKKGINKGCDFIILFGAKKNYTALIIEIKSGKPNLSEALHQLDNSELYLNYLLSIVKHYYKANIKNIDVKKIIVTTDKRIRHRGATFQPNNKHPSLKGCNIVPITPKTKYRIAHISLEKLSR